VSLGCHGNSVSHSPAVSLVTLTLTVCFPLFPFFHLTVPQPFCPAHTESDQIHPHSSINETEKSRQSRNGADVVSWLSWIVLKYSIKKGDVVRWWCVWAKEQIDNKGERNVAALALITYLWIRLISKPTAKKHTVKEMGGVRGDEGGTKRRGAPNTHSPPRTLSLRWLNEHDFVERWFLFLFVTLLSLLFLFIGQSLWEVISC